MPTLLLGRRAHVASGGEIPAIIPRRPAARNSLILPRSLPIRGASRPLFRRPPSFFDAFAPPTASAISGMSSTPFLDYDWTGATPTGDWFIQDGAPVSNNELTTSKPSNVAVISDGSVSGGKYLELTMKVESYAGFTMTGVQMENFFSGPSPGVGGHFGFGQGNPFFIECRMRYSGFSGMWIGPWTYDIDSTGTPNGQEMDVMETINTRQPKTTLHSADAGHILDVGTQDYAATNDGDWHRYGIRIDGSTIKWYFDNALVITLSDATKSAGFMNANMGLKIQAFVGGNFPDSDAGVTTPVGGTTFPRHWDCDWLRVYR